MSLTWSWKPRLETLETREVPALFSLLGGTLQNVVYPPPDETLPPPPPPPPPTTDPGPIVYLPPPTPIVPGG